MRQDQTLQIKIDTANSADSSSADGPRRLTSGNVLAGFLPAFRHLETGEVRLCRLENGGLASGHLLDNLPDHWILDRDPGGRASGLVYAIEPGFLRGIEFWSLEDLRHPALDA